MEAAAAGWGAGVVLSVTGLPRDERAAIQHLVERAGGRYSPNLSRRCTHLAVPACAQQQQGQQQGGLPAAVPSEKLRIAWRNRQKWGLQIVDLRWVLECAQAQQRLDEAAFPVQPPPSTNAVPGGKEQAAPNASAGRREHGRPGTKCGSGGDGGGDGGDDSSALAADTYHSRSSAGLPAATVAAAAARMQRTADPLRHSVNSRPLSSFGQPTRSLQSLRTQAPSAQVQAPSGSSMCGRVRWQEGLGGADTAAAPPSDDSCSPRGHGAAAVLPEQLERHHWAHQEEAEDDPFAEPCRLPMTQAGFLPAADLLEQLRASTASLPPTGSKPSELQAGQLQQQGGSRAVLAAPASGAAAGSRDASPVTRQRQNVLAWEHGRRAAGLLPVAAPSLQSKGHQQQPGPAPMDAGPAVRPLAADAPAQCQKEQAMLAAGQLERPRLCPGGPVQQRQLQTSVGMLPFAQQQQQPLLQQPQPAPQQQVQQQAPPTAELLRQLRQSSNGSLPAQQLHPPFQRQHAVASAADLLEHLQLSASRPAPPPQQQQQRQLQGRSGAVNVAELLDQLRSAGTAAAEGQPGSSRAAAQRAGVSINKLIQQLQASDAGAFSYQHQPEQQRRLQGTQQRVDTAGLLAQLQSACIRAPDTTGQQQQGRQPILTTADLLQQLNAQVEGLPAAAALQQQQAAPSAAELLQQLQAGIIRLEAAAMPAATALPLEASQAAAGPSDAAGAAAGGGSTSADLAGLLQQLRELAPVASPVPGTGPASAGQQEGQQQHAVVRAHHNGCTARSPGSQATAAAAGLQAALPCGLPVQYQPQHAATAWAAAATGISPGAAATGPAGGGRTTEELLQLLRQQAQQAEHGPSASLPDAVTGSSDELLQKLRSLAPQHSFTPLPRQPQQLSAAAGVAAKQAQPPACRSAASEDEEAPPAKYQRMQQSPAGAGPQPAAGAAAPGGQEQVEQSPLAAAAPAQQGPAEQACAGGDGGTVSVAPTAVVLGGQAELPPAGSPASSAGSPATRTAPAPLEAAATAGPLPAGGNSGHSPGLGSEASQVQVAESGGRVFAGMLALVDPSLGPEEQQRICTALRLGGAQLADGGGLCSGATHVVCHPGAALRWLSLGVGIVSPQWVLQSLRSGKQRRCLTVSADASRHLPAASTAAPPSEGAMQPHAASGDGSSRDGIPQQPAELSAELLASREARQQMLSQLLSAGGSPAAVAGSCAADGTAGAAAHQQATTPSELLSGVLWAVTDPPERAAARKEGLHAAQAAQQEADNPLIIPDSEEEEEAQMCCISASQAAVADLLHEAAVAPGGRCQQQAAGAAPWQEAAVLRGPAELALLLPRDARGELGLDTRCFPLPAKQRQLTAGQLLSLVYRYYQEQLSPQEQLQLLQSFPAAKGVAAVLRCAFLELAPLSRGALLGSRVSFEGLRKASREPAAAVYEVNLE